MDIGSGKGYPAAALSNFTPRCFTFDGVACCSIEGVLQSFKFENKVMQEYVCTLVGLKAKYKGKNKTWWKQQKLYWNNVVYDRHSEEYQELLNRLYYTVFTQCESFKKALLATGSAVLTHNIGNIDPHRTVLTRQEFISRLIFLREKAVRQERRLKYENK